jgi:hypothetical protein
MLLGDPLPATRLHDLGLIARCVPAGQLEAEAAKVIDRLAANAPLSLKAMKAVTVRQLEFRAGIPTTMSTPWCGRRSPASRTRGKACWRGSRSARRGFRANRGKWSNTDQGSNCDDRTDRPA